MNLRSLIRVIFGGGPGSGCQGQNCGRPRTASYEGSKGLPWESSSGLARTGSKGAYNALAKLELFRDAGNYHKVEGLRTNTMSQIPSKKTIRTYKNHSGHTLTVYHDPSFHTVHATLTGPEEEHTRLQQALSMSPMKVRRAIYEKEMRRGRVAV